jgi:hypothetical protein
MLFPPPPVSPQYSPALTSAIEATYVYNGGRVFDQQLSDFLLTKAKYYNIPVGMFTVYKIVQDRTIEIPLNSTYTIKASETAIQVQVRLQ